MVKMPCKQVSFITKHSSKYYVLNLAEMYQKHRQEEQYNDSQHMSSAIVHGTTIV